MRGRNGNFHSLKRIKIRQDWNKYNLFNLQRLRLLQAQHYTLFQQKWKSKSATRAYHGERIKETLWKRMFSRRIHAVAPQNPDALASEDGAKFAAGRGSGLSAVGGEKPSKVVPYMQMTYYPAERRLDTAIFRALFASSAKQARQFVIHGHAKVNGKQMRYPGYLLNPGDMFQVDPESVLFATGAGKGTSPNPNFVGSGAEPESDDVDADAPVGGETAGVDQANNSTVALDEVLDEDEEDQFDEEEEDDDDDDVGEEDTEADSSDPQVQIKAALKSLRKRTKYLLENPPKNKLRPKQKQALRALSKSLKSTLSRAGSTTQSTVDDLEAEFQNLSDRITNESTPQTNSQAALSADSAPPPSSDPDAKPPSPEDPEIAEALRRAEENPVDPSKPYATPWRPRDYMAPFAFIPRYLEVNQNICSAVYLRHPVVRPNLGEVPTPFHPETSALAFNWYLRRR